MAVSQILRKPGLRFRLRDLALMLGACLAVAVIWGAVIRTLTDPGGPLPVTGQPRALSWGNRVFESKAALKAWLIARDVDYRTWAANHADAIRILDHRPPPKPVRGLPANRQVAPTRRREAVATHAVARSGNGL